MKMTVYWHGKRRPETATAFGSSSSGIRTRSFRFAFHLLRDPHAAEDAAQDAFVKAFRRIDSFRPERGSFAAWIGTITRNTCLDALERRRRDQPVAQESGEETGFQDRSVEEREIFSLLDAAPRRSRGTLSDSFYPRRDRGTAAAGNRRHGRRGAGNREIPRQPGTRKNYAPN